MRKQTKPKSRYQTCSVCNKQFYVTTTDWSYKFSKGSYFVFQCSYKCNTAALAVRRNYNRVR